MKTYHFRYKNRIIIKKGMNKQNAQFKAIRNIAKYEKRAIGLCEVKFIF